MAAARELLDRGTDSVAVSGAGGELGDERVGDETLEADSPEAGGGQEGHVTAAPERALLDRREELVAPSADELARRLKRSLLEQQNDLLDALRHRKKDEDPVALVTSAPTAERLLDAANGALATAFRAGTAFAAEVGWPDGAPAPGQTRAGAADGAALAVAADLAADVAAHLTARLEQGMSGLGQDDSGLPALVGAVYREWKGERVERLAAEYASRAFADGVAAVAEAGGLLVRWVVDDGAEGCPDCDDNEIAGGQPVAEPFPTGHLRPPAHPGCRCLLVPVHA